MIRFSSFAVILLLIVILTSTHALAGFDSKAMSETAMKAGSSRRIKSSFHNMSSAKAAAPKKKYKDGELLVKFKPEASDERKKNLHKKHGAEKLKEFPSLRLHHIKLKKGMSIEEAVKLYQADPEVEYAEPNFLYSIQGQPNDSRFGELWGLQNTGQTGGTAGADIKAPAAWDITTGSSDVVVAIIDTGIDYTHPDLAGNIWTTPGIDVVNQDSDPFDDQGHGTHVAGTIGAMGNNSTGVVGINWNVKLTACKFLDASGSGTTDGAIQCLQYVKSLKDAGANIVATNNSWGGGGFSQALYDAINAQRDILFIAAAGNNSNNNDVTPNYPSGYDLPNVISVAATDSSDLLASFSNFGKSTVDVGAPGSAILSTLPAQNSFNIAGGYGILSGTSMATPHVTGLAALLKAQDPARDWKKIRNLILSSGDDIPALSEKSLTGKRINALRSLTCSNRPMLGVSGIPSSPITGQSYTISVVSINCDAPAGPVTVTTSDGASFDLLDSGIAPDVAADDGVFTGTWTAGAMPVMLTFSSPAGSQSIGIPSLNASWYIADARKGAPYSQPLVGTGGFPPYAWSIAGGALPAGLVLNPVTGIISGQAAVTGSYPFTAELIDSRGQKLSVSLTLNVVDSPAYEIWGSVYRGRGETYGFAVTMDAAQNSYVTGRLDGSANRDIFLAKYSPTGNLLWTRTYDRGMDEYGRSVACDAAGNVYIAGFSGWPDSSRRLDNLLLKYDPSGNLLWDRAWKDASSTAYLSEGLFGIASDAAGYLYTVGGVGLIGDFKEQIELSKYDSAGNRIWSNIHDSTSSAQYGYSVAVDGNGNAYFGGYTIARPVTHADGFTQYYWDSLLAKYNSSGNLVWEKTQNDAGPEGWNDLTGIAVDGAGNLVATGTSGSTTAYGVTMKYDPSGNMLWKSTTTGGNFWSKSIAVSGDNIYVAGELETPIQIIKYNHLGAQAWSRIIDAGDYDSAEGIAADSAGFTVTGYSRKGGRYGAITARYLEPPFEDLIVTGLTGTLSGNKLSYTVKVKRSGAGSEAVPVGLYFSTDAAASTDDYQITLLDAGSIAVGTEVMLTDTVTIPGTIPDGNYYLAALADPSSIIPEDDENNNGRIAELYSIGSINYSRVGTGTGAVTFDQDTSRTKNCSLSYAAGTRLTLTAIPDNDSVFTGWEGACTGTGSCSVTVASNTQITARFEKKTVLNFSRWGTGAGTVTFNPGTSCKSNCSQYYDFGSVVTLTASPDVGSVFKGWEGACTGTGSCTVALDGDQAVSATFINKLKSPFAAGSWHTGLLLDGNVWMWGGNFSGQMGDGTTIQHIIPRQIPDLSGVTAIAAGVDTSHTLAVKGDGTVWAWGDNSSGQLGDGTTTQRKTPTHVPGLTQVVAVTGGYLNSMALKEDGTVWSWGSNNDGQLGNGTNTSQQLSPLQVANLSGVSAIAAGDYHSIALKDNGTMWTWGYNRYGQLGDGTATTRSSPAEVTGISDVVAIAAGTYHTVALRLDGTVWTWGANWKGQLGDGTTTDRTSPFQVPGLSEIVAIAAGEAFTVALKADGTVLSWGDNYYGQLGDGTTRNQRATPVQVAGLSDVSSIAAGSYHTLAAKRDGTIWAWGENGHSQLGDGTTTSRATPVEVTIATMPPITTVSPLGNTYNYSPTVTLTADTPATIYYTLDGSTPTTGSPVYMAPLTISSTTTLKYFARDAAGNSEPVKTQTYTILPAGSLIADFNSIVTTGDAPLSVRFDVSYSGTPTSWLWDFGDSSTSTLRDATHTYNNPGSYTVSLTVTNAVGSYTETKANYITAVGTGPSALQPAYSNAADGATIRVRAGDLTENPVFNRNVAVTIVGGYDFPYQSIVGATTVHGSITVSNGVVALENLVIK